MDTHLAALRKLAAVMETGKYYQTSRVSRDTLGYWVYALEEQKNGGMVCVFVTWWSDRRLPDKGKLQSVDSSWMRDWKEIDKSDVPPQVLSKMQSSGRMAASPPLQKVARIRNEAEAEEFLEGLEGLWVKMIEEWDHHITVARQEARRLEEDQKHMVRLRELDVDSWKMKDWSVAEDLMRRANNLGVFVETHRELEEAWEILHG